MMIRFKRAEHMAIIVHDPIAGEQIEIGISRKEVHGHWIALGKQRCKTPDCPSQIDKRHATSKVARTVHYLSIFSML